MSEKKIGSRSCPSCGGVNLVNVYGCVEGGERNYESECSFCGGEMLYSSDLTEVEPLYLVADEAIGMTEEELKYLRSKIK